MVAKDDPSTNLPHFSIFSLVYNFVFMHALFQYSYCYWMPHPRLPENTYYNNNMPPETTFPHLGHRQLDWNTVPTDSIAYLGFQGFLWLALPCQDIECKIKPFSCCINIISLLIYVINRQWRIQEFRLDRGVGEAREMLSETWSVTWGVPLPMRGNQEKI